MLRSTIRTLVANALWLATTVVQVVAWLYQLLAAAGLNLWLRTCGGIVVFSMVLLPGFLSVAWRLATKPESVLVHDLQYGTERRQYVDVYLPQRGTGAARLRTQKQGTAEAAIAPSIPDAAGGGAPVVLFLAGGGWTIGYKYWGAGIGFRLAARGVLVVCADYRQFPQTSVSGMLEDVQLALKWTVRNAARFGGDPRKVIIMGQSAGAHLATLYTLTAAAARAAKGASAAAKGAGAPTAGSRAGPPLPAAVIALSGVYHMPSALAPFRRRGMTPAMVAGIFGSADEAALTHHSPLCAAQALFEQLAAQTLAEEADSAAKHGVPPADRRDGRTVGPLYADVVASPTASPRSSKLAPVDHAALPTLPPSVADTPSNTRGRPSPVDGADSDLDELDEAGKPGLASPLSGEGSTAWPSLGSLEDGDGPTASDPTAPAGERPLIAFLHGTDDTVAALSQAKELHATLTSAGWPSALGVYEAGTHTGPLIEDAMSDGDYLLEDLTDICRHVSAQVSPEGAEPTVVLAPGTRGVVAAGKVRAGKPGFPAFGAHVEPRTRLSFPVCIAIAKAVNPF